jgi:NACalpha-BTF3-like transcription factor
MASLLLLELHGRLLRELASSTGMHFQGLQQAGRWLHKSGMSTTTINRRLRDIDVAANIVRHITQVSCDSYFKEIISHVNAAADQQSASGLRHSMPQHRSQEVHAVRATEGRQRPVEQPPWKKAKHTREAGSEKVLRWIPRHPDGVQAAPVAAPARRHADHREDARGHDHHPDGVPAAPVAAPARRHADHREDAHSVAAQTQAAAAMGGGGLGGGDAPAESKAAAVEDDGDDGEVDEEGVERKDIELVTSQVHCSKAKAIKALKAQNNDIVEAIMQLTSS